MSTSYTITITDNELKVLGSVINPVLPGNKQWAEDALKNRARIATNEIQQNLYKHCTQNGITIGVGVMLLELIILLPLVLDIELI